MKQFGRKFFGLLLLLALILPMPCISIEAVGADSSVYVEEIDANALPKGEYEDEAGVYLTLFEGLLSGAETIDLSGFALSVDEIGAIFERVYYSEAELFFLSESYSYTVRGKGEEQVVLNIKPKYELEADKIPEALADFRARTEEILALVDEETTPLGRVMFVHDYIATHFTYDNSFTNYDAYSFLVDGTGVCQAYALLARYLLRRLGVPTECVVSDALVHEWNIVKLGEEWYHIDITWDDRDDGGLYGQVNRDYFLSSDAHYRTGRHNAPWEAHTEANDTRYENVFTEVSSAFAIDGPSIYAIRDGCISLFDEGEGLFTPILEITDRWQSHPAVPGQYWVGTFSGLTVFNGYLVYNTPTKIYLLSPKTGEARAISELTVGPSGYLYGMIMQGDSIVYSLKTDPNADTFKKGEHRIAYTVTWDLMGTKYEESYFYGDTPSYKGDFSVPEDQYRYTFRGWDKTIARVDEDVTYTAVFDAEQLYPASCAAMIKAVAAVDEAGTLAERHALLLSALGMVDRVNPNYPGYTEACARLSELALQYDSIRALAMASLNVLLPSCDYGE